MHTMDAIEVYAANASDSEQCHSTPEYVPFLVTAQLIIAAMAIVGNGITLAMISKHPTLRQAKEYPEVVKKIDLIS